MAGQRYDDDADYVADPRRTSHRDTGEDSLEQDSEERAFVTRYNRAELAILSIEEEVGRLEKRLDLVLVDANMLPTKEAPENTENTAVVKELHHSEALRRLETLERQALVVRRRVQSLIERVDI